MAGTMHPGEVPTDAALVARLVAEQFTAWAGLPVEPAPSAGTDNALYRLGDDMVVRLPRIGWAAGQPEKECRWLPGLAPRLPLPIPAPLACGEPAGGYPWRWSIAPWLPGENATLDRVADLDSFAADLDSFVTTLHGIDASGGPTPGAHNSGRGVPLALRDADTRAAIAEFGDRIDGDAATAAWDAALSAPVWDGPPVWVHGDIQSGNLLVVDGRLSAVIDFGCLGAGDPAVDLIVAWNLLPAGPRETF
ncbi:MAG TPA: aminoglycoside phosphotransferase family protein, partial [Thermomicrobiales bacterium]|nr:aminoglycoside phosphotransferase family protein [Thermomicrobiales bacterium]